LGQIDQAIALYERVLELAPDHIESRYNLALAFVELGNDAEAIRQYHRILAANPGHAPTIQNLARLFESRGDIAQALALLRDSLQRLAHLQLMHQLCWLLATGPDPELRNGLEAMELAEQLIEKTGGEQPEALDARAAANAELGRFDEAVADATRAARIARAQNKVELARSIELRAQLYRAHMPFRNSRTGNESHHDSP
jgi:tetratricopeptide (TPR) repeat protein